MSKRLADLKAKPKSLPTRIVAKICVDLEALADVQRLDQESAELLAEKRALQPQDEDGAVKKPKRMVLPPRVAEIDARLAEIEGEQEDLLARMRESEGDILIRAVDSGEWQRFKDDNPPREGNRSDDEFTYGLCNATELIADLGRFVVSWGEDNLEPGAWDEWFGERVAPGDKAEICKAVMQNQESRVSIPKARSTASSASPQSVSA